MKIHDVQQGTPEWLELRLGVPTASELDQLIAPSTLQIRKGEMPASYIARKLAERWLGRSVETASSWAMEQGSILESEARPLLSIRLGVEIRTVGFVTTDDGLFGASPDGLLDDGSGVEIKCPLPATHFRYLMSGEVPPDYALQCQGGMYATGAKRWTFMSYCRGAPPLIVEVARDERAQEAIEVAVQWFAEQSATAYARILELNGGAPERAASNTDRNTVDLDPFATLSIPGEVA